MIKVIKYSLPLIILFIAGCGDRETDITSPELVVNEFTPEPIEAELCGTIEPGVFLLTGGDELVFDVTFKDDKALSQYKLDIHNNFDCHGHGGGSVPSVVVPNVVSVTEDWTVLDIQELSGISSSIQHTLSVPENVTAGNYHFQIQVLDESGNDNPLANFYSLKIEHPLDKTSPQISVSQPTETSFTVQKGNSIHFKGTVTDNLSLSNGGNGVLYLAYTDLSSGNTFNTDQVFSFDENTETEYDFDFEYTIPQTLVTGDYRLSLGATDGVRNVAEFQFFDIEVIN